MIINNSHLHYIIAIMILSVHEVLKTLDELGGTAGRD